MQIKRGYEVMKDLTGVIEFVRLIWPAVVGCLGCPNKSQWRDGRVGKRFLCRNGRLISNSMPNAKLLSAGTFLHNHAAIADRPETIPKNQGPRTRVRGKALIACCMLRTTASVDLSALVPSWLAVPARIATGGACMMHD